VCPRSIFSSGPIVRRIWLTLSSATSSSARTITPTRTRVNASTGASATEGLQAQSRPVRSKKLWLQEQLPLSGNHGLYLIAVV